MDLSNENVVHIKEDEIEYLQFKRLLEYKDIVTHCFSLKPLDFGSNKLYYDNERDIKDNYKKICKSLGLDIGDIIRPIQTHTDCIKEVDKEVGFLLEEFNNVDGLITNRKDKILSLLYADCTPLYFLDPNKKIIANVHSGWKGTSKRIGQKTANTLVKKHNCNPKDIICVIGPTIRKCHFIVEEDVKNIFEEEFKEMYLDDIIGIDNNDKTKYLIDTVKININMLLEEGLIKENIIDSGICSVCCKEAIHSYRGDNKTAKRNTSLICLK